MLKFRLNDNEEMRREKNTTRKSNRIEWAFILLVASVYRIFVAADNMHCIHRQIDTDIHSHIYACRIVFVRSMVYEKLESTKINFSHTRNSLSYPVRFLSGDWTRTIFVLFLLLVGSNSLRKNCIPNEMDITLLSVRICSLNAAIWIVCTEYYSCTALLLECVNNNH